KLRTQMTISKQVALFPVIQLEKLTGLYQKLFPLHGYHVSAYDLFDHGSGGASVSSSAEHDES
ncbi:MAG: hypothetical protein WBI18_04515, partial [Candidatus Saccharicenans sp.]